MKYLTQLFKSPLSLFRPSADPATINPDTRAKAGRSMFEILGVIIIGTIITTTGVIGYNYGMTLLRTQSLSTQLNSIVMGVRDLNGGRAGYGTASYNSLLINSGRAPSDTISGTAMLNPFGGTWVVTGSTATFLVQSDEIPRDICVKAATISGAVSVLINGTAMPLTSGSVSSVDAQDECNQATNTLTWGFN